ncbi:MAG: isopenicillin N synthase family oxygenase [Planctomycetes bacterium]|nr:isopenicillin N synthase family oxygenase [Planctomycetota bacterium]
MLNAVSLVDFDDGSSRGDLGQRLYRALAETGFVRLRNPREYDFELVRAVYRAAERFFELPETELLKLRKAELQGERGYMPCRVEKAQGASQPDEKRYFSVGREGDGVHANLWPDESLLPGFSQLLRQCFSMFDRVAHDLAASLGPLIGVPELADGLAGGDSLWRLIHYDPLTGQEPRDAVRSHEHQDVGLLTLLPTATAAGLQIRTAAGWADVLGGPDELIVNCGDALELLARAQGHRLPSTVHRVVNGDGRRRISAPFFCHVRRDFVLDPGTGETEGAFLDRRLAEIIGN